MGKHRPLTRRRHASSRTGYITAAVLGLTVGVSAWTMSHPANPAVPSVTFGTAADTPVPAAGPTPTATRSGFVLTP